jgi:membrane-associated phospholipid phosphatase
VTVVADVDTGATQSAVIRLVCAMVVLAALAVGVSDQTFLWGEVAVLERTNDLPTWAGWPLRLVMQLGTLWVALVVVALVAWWTRDRGPGPAVAVLVAALVGFRLDNVIKDVIDRPRPPAVLADLQVRETIGGFGFPSGHTTMAFALAAALHSSLPHRWRWVPWVIAIIVGVARMHVGVHWPADVVGGAALGTAIGSAAWLLATAAMERGARIDAPATGS